MRIAATCGLWVAVVLSCGQFVRADEPTLRPFGIHVVDESTGRGVPLVELRTVNNVSYYTDSAGWVAVAEPGLMNQKVFFTVESHGYEFPADGFGYRGKAFDIQPGGSEELKIRRLNMAERLYRMTGEGIYRDTLLLGQKAPIEQPLLNAQVYGSDSVENAIYRGKLYWFWGDTNRPSYPLGNFNTPGAVSQLPANGGLDPDRGVNLTYFQAPDGFAKAMAKMPGEGPTWISGLVVVRDGDRERMFAGYVKVRGMLDVYQHGLCEFNDEQQQFEKAVEFPEKQPMYPSGHPFLRRDGGVEYVYFANPYALVRLPAKPEAIRDLSTYEAFTCLEEGTTSKQARLDRTAEGALRYRWKKNTPPVGPREQAQLVRSGAIKPDEGPLQLRDIETGKPVQAHTGSTYWNEYRKRWVMITVQSSGESSHLGELWYAEAESPLGPWVYARRIMTHNKYSFYNPKQHPMFDQEGGRVLYFEGTYTTLFSGNTHPTPRYDYNQMMYRLNLDDERIVLPVPVYDVSLGNQVNFRTTRGEISQAPAFFALDRPQKGAIAVYSEGDRLHLGDGSKPLFYALPDNNHSSGHVTYLYEFVGPEEQPRVYTTDASWSRAGYRRSGRPLCRVWKAYGIAVWPPGSHPSGAP